MTARDDFTRKTVDILARRAGGKCSICHSSTYGPNDNPYTSTNIGKAAHISAASEGGPRYDAAMSPEVRKSLKNGIWLCSNCHDKIDRNPETYTVQYLKKLKNEAETTAKKVLGVPPPELKQGKEFLASSVSAVAIVDIRKVLSRLQEHHGSNTLSPTDSAHYISEIDFIDFRRDSYLPEVGKEVVRFLFRLSGYKHAPDIYLEILRHVQEVANVFVESWDADEVKEVCELVKSVAKGHNTNSSVHQSALALLKDIVKLSKEKGNKEGMNITKDCLQELVQKRVRGVTRGVTGAIDDTDYYMPSDDDDDDGVIPSAKRRRGLGQEENTTLQYLEKMMELSESVAKGNEEETIEQEILKMGFESNIL